MKRSSGTRSRIKGLAAGPASGPVQPEPRHHPAGTRRWAIPGAAAAAALCLIVLMVLPCSRRCRDADPRSGRTAGRHLESDMHASGRDDAPALDPKPPAEKRRITPAKRTVPKGALKKIIPEEPKVYDFGTKLEMILPPEKR